MSCSSFESGSENLKCEPKLDAQRIFLISSLLGRDNQRRKRRNYASKYSSNVNSSPAIQSILTAHQLHLNNFWIRKDAVKRRICAEYKPNFVHIKKFFHVHIHILVYSHSLKLTDTKTIFKCCKSRDLFYDQHSQHNKVYVKLKKRLNKKHILIHWYMMLLVVEEYIMRYFQGCF